jgi:hypothetical protein
LKRRLLSRFAWQDEPGIGEDFDVVEGAVTSGGKMRGAAPGSVLTGLIGMDIQSSRSPEMHMREAAAQGIALHYELFDLAARTMHRPISPPRSTRCNARALRG